MEFTYAPVCRTGTSALDKGSSSMATLLTPPPPFAAERFCIHRTGIYGHGSHIVRRRGSRSTGWKLLQRDFLASRAGQRPRWGSALGVAQFGGNNLPPSPGKARVGGLRGRGDHDGNTYRAVYTVRFKEVNVSRACLQKKSPGKIKTAQVDYRSGPATVEGRATGLRGPAMAPAPKR
jgi:hypothetical protein